MNKVKCRHRLIQRCLTCMDARCVWLSKTYTLLMVDNPSRYMHTWSRLYAYILYHLYCKINGTCVISFIRSANMRTKCFWWQEGVFHSTWWQKTNHDSNTISNTWLTPRDLTIMLSSRGNMISTTCYIDMTRLCFPNTFPHSNDIRYQLHIICILHHTYGINAAHTYFDSFFVYKHGIFDFIPTQQSAGMHNRTNCL